MTAFATSLLPQTADEMTAFLSNALSKRKNNNNIGGGQLDDTGLRATGKPTNPFDTNTKEMKGVIASLGLNSTNEGKDKAINNPKKAEVRQRLNKVVNAVIDGFIGQQDDQLQNITNLVRNLLITDPKAASALLQRLLPKQVDLNLETSERVKSSIVLVDKSKHLHVQNVQQSVEPVKNIIDANVSEPDEQDSLTLDVLKPLPQRQVKEGKQEAWYYEANRKNAAAGYPVDPPNLHMQPLVAPPKDDSPEEIARFAADIKAMGPKYQQMIELKKHFPDVKVPKFHVQNAKLAQIRKVTAQKRGRPKNGVPVVERRPAYSTPERAKLDAEIAAKAEKYKQKQTPGDL